MKFIDGEFYYTREEYNVLKLICENRISANFWIVFMSGFLFGAFLVLILQAILGG